MRRTVDRREFVKTMGAAGALSAVGAAARADAAQAGQAAGGAEFQRPANLRVTTNSR